MLKEHNPVIIQENIPGSLDVGATAGGAEKGEEGHIVDVHEGGYTVEVVMDDEGRGRLVDLDEDQVRLDWRRYWTEERIKRLRSTMGKTQKEMGQLVWEGPPATARKNFANLERGATRPSASVARILGHIEEGRLDMNRA